MPSSATATFGITVPNFVVAPLLQLVFGLALAGLPVGGWNDGALRNTILPIADAGAAAGRRRDRAPDARPP